MRKLRFALVAVLFAAGVWPVNGQEKASANRFTTDHYFELERVSNAQISPDGARIVYTREQANRLEDKWDTALWIMNADGSQHRFLAKGSNPQWAPDSKRILYLADGEPRGTQIFVRWIDAEGPATQITRATEKVADARWSPDGKVIAFSMFVPAKNKWTISHTRKLLAVSILRDRSVLLSSKSSKPSRPFCEPRSGAPWSASFPWPINSDRSLPTDP